MKYTPTQTQAAVTSGMANLNLAPPPPTNAAANVNPPPPMFAPQNFALNPGHMPIPAVSTRKLVSPDINLCRVTCLTYIVAL